MGAEESEAIRRIIHSELEKFNNQQRGDFRLNDAVRAWWPVLLVAITGLVWFVRLESKVESHESLEWHAGMSKTASDIATIKADVKHLREDLIDVKKSMGTTTSISRP